MNILQRISIAICSGLIITSVIAMFIRKDAPRKDIKQCELAGFAFDYFGEWSGAANVADLITQGLFVENPLRKDELSIYLVRIDSHGNEDAKMHWLKFNAWTGNIEALRMSDSPERIREMSRALYHCIE